jgi:hypothetical protein
VVRLLSVVLTSFGAIVTSGGWRKVAAAFGLGVALVVSSLFHVIVTPFRQRDEARRWAKKLKAKLDEPHSRKAVELDARLDPLGRPQYPVLVISASGYASARDVVVEFGTGDGSLVR